MKKIKVAQVITRMDWGGSPDIVRIICSHLDSDIFDVRLVVGLTEHPSAKTSAFMGKFGDKITVIPQLKRNIEPLNDLIAFIKLYVFFKKERFDIVHTHTAKAGTLGRAAAFLSATGPAIIHTPHGHNFYGY
ncbi:MAG: glycosyltransferase, partial [Candidatus Omnitrophica bacterium]|nr:glycosyltransferase [Candidatus Omnitrophota bacterium]